MVIHSRIHWNRVPLDLGNLVRDFTVGTVVLERFQNGGDGNSSWLTVVMTEEWMDAGLAMGFTGILIGGVFNFREFCAVLISGQIGWIYWLSRLQLGSIYRCNEKDIGRRWWFGWLFSCSHRWRSWDLLRVQRRVLLLERMVNDQWLIRKLAGIYLNWNNLGGLSYWKRLHLFRRMVREALSTHDDLSLDENARFGCCDFCLLSFRADDLCESIVQKSMVQSLNGFSIGIMYLWNLAGWKQKYSELLVIEWIGISWKLSFSLSDLMGLTLLCCGIMGMISTIQNLSTNVNKGISYFWYLPILFGDDDRGGSLIFKRLCSVRGAFTGTTFKKRTLRGQTPKKKTAPRNTRIGNGLYSKKTDGGEGKPCIVVPPKDVV